MPFLYWSYFKFLYTFYNWNKHIFLSCVHIFFSWLVSITVAPRVYKHGRRETDCGSVEFNNIWQFPWSYSYHKKKKNVVSRYVVYTVQRTMWLCKQWTGAHSVLIGCDLWLSRCTASLCSRIQLCPAWLGHFVMIIIKAAAITCTRVGSKVSVHATVQQCSQFTDVWVCRPALCKPV